MKPLAKLLPLLWLSALGAQAAPTPQLRDVLLDEHVVQIIPVAGNRVTTVSFPSPITAVDAALVTTDAKTPGLFHFSHAPGTAFFSVRALARSAVTNLNVRWNNKTYVFELRESSEPVYSVVLSVPSSKTGSTPARPLTPVRLLGLLDKAKAYPILQKNFPAEAAEMEHRVWSDADGLTQCDDYDIHLREAFRFPEALIFRINVRNKTDRPVTHEPEKIQVRVGEQNFEPALADLPPQLQPGEEVGGYLVLAGLSTGGNLALKNDFTFVLTRQPEHQPAKVAPSVQLNPLPTK